MRTLSLTIIFIIILLNNIFAQCDGGDPSTNGPSWNSGQTIEDNFNNARRWEENDRGLPANCLGNMTEISGGWASATNDEIALYIHNSEREARGHLPLHCVEDNMDAVAQAHSEWQINNDVFSHGGDPALGSNYSFTQCSDCGSAITGSSPFDRMNQSAPLAGQYQYESENIAVFVTSGSSISNSVARGIYNFNYRDAGSAWGHRDAVLHDYDDNWGDTGDEGFIGVGVFGGNNYEACAFSCNNWNYAEIVTVDYYDPQGSATGYSCSVLPVELLSFNAKEVDGDIELNWVTVSEENSEYFLIEKSGDGRNFIEIGKVYISDKFTGFDEYSFIDKEVYSGENYYRLKILDYDGSYTYSEMINISMRIDEFVNIYPNPVFDILYIDFENESYDSEIIIYNIYGQIAKRIYLSTGEIDLSNLESGTYIYVLKGRNGAKIKNGKLIKL